MEQVPQAVWFGLLALLIACFAAVGVRQRRQAQQRDLTNKVKIWMDERNKRPEDAVRAIESFFGDTLPLPQDLHLQYMVALYWVGREDDLQKVLDAYPTDNLDEKGFYDLARKLELVGRMDDAVEYYKRIQRLDPDYADVRMRVQRLTQKNPSDAALGIGLDPSSIPRHLESKFQRMELIGRGGMGFVFKAWDVRRKRWVALKALSPFLADQGQALERFLREAKLLAKFEHPNVVKIFDVEEKPLTYYTMEFVDGQSLGQKMESQGSFEVQEVLDLGMGILGGLLHVHKHGVVHRDIKPENIMLGEDGTPRLTDFGLAVNTEATRITATGQVMGTLRYMPPEQLRGEETGPTGDLFAVGVTLYECLTGHHAFEGQDRFNRKLVGTLGEVVDRDLPPGLISLIELLMEPHPENRLGSAAEAIEMLRSLRRETIRRTPATFLHEVLLLKNRSVDALASFFAGLSGLDSGERDEFFEESGNVRDLKLLVWNLNEAIGRVQAVGKPPPGSDPRGWARKVGGLRNDLARYVRNREASAIDAFALRIRQISKEIDAFLDPYRLGVGSSVLQTFYEQWADLIQVEVPDHDIAAFACPDVEAVREELLAAIRCLADGARPVLDRVAVKIQLKKDDDVWLLELEGPNIEKDHVKAALLFEAMGAEVGFQEPGVFKAWLPVVIEDAPSRAQASVPPTGRSGTFVMPAVGGEEVVEDIG